MSARIRVRRPRLNPGAGFEPVWMGGDAFRTQVFNALSMSFPVGEKYFIDTLRESLSQLDDPDLVADIRGYIGQEAVHSHLHRDFNRVLNAQGLPNLVEPLASWRIRHSTRLDLRSHLAIVMAYEHFTAVFGDAILRGRGWLDGADQDMTLLWSWHALEESEHKAVAFDTYRHLGGGYLRRVTWFVYISLILGLDCSVQTVVNLYHSGHLWRLRTWRNALKFLFGPAGVYPHTLPHWFAYLRAGFHPNDNDISMLARNWVQEHAALFR